MYLIDGSNAVDTISPERRSINMRRIKSSDTKPERQVRAALRRMKIRYRTQRKELPGTPDFFLIDKQVALFVHGCFWHRHRRCKFAYTPKSRVDFWQAKFKANQNRDRAVRRQLRKLGVPVVVVWECQTKSLSGLADLLPVLISKALKQ